MNDGRGGDVTGGNAVAAVFVEQGSCDVAVALLLEIAVPANQGHLERGVAALHFEPGRAASHDHALTEHDTAEHRLGLSVIARADGQRHPRHEQIAAASGEIAAGGIAVADTQPRVRNPVRLADEFGAENRHRSGQFSAVDADRQCDDIGRSDEW